MLSLKNGGWRVHIWYRIQPRAQISAFSPYGKFCTISGLCGNVNINNGTVGKMSGKEYLTVLYNLKTVEQRL